MATIDLETAIGATPECCFDVSRDIGFHLRSMSDSLEQVVAGRASGLIGLDEEVTWRGRHFGVMHTHRSRITEFNRPAHFRDVMVEGRFRRFEHDHFFEGAPGGTLMRDRIQFESPLGVLGWLVDRFVMTAYLARLIVERNRAIKREAEGRSSA
jgi:ligand-binding SRPBCC domain-containing protein